MKLQDFRDKGPLTQTRHAKPDIKLYIWKQGPAMWRYVVDQDGDAATVGETYKTKMEAFCDLGRIAESWGFTS